MRFMILVKADASSEAGVLPKAGLVARMGALSAEMAKAGVLLGAEGLRESSRGAKVSISRGKRAVFDGPFAEAKELIAGFMIIEVSSKDEAIGWAGRVAAVIVEEQSPDGAELEVRQLFEAADFAGVSEGAQR